MRPVFNQKQVSVPTDISTLKYKSPLIILLQQMGTNYVEYLEQTYDNLTVRSGHLRGHFNQLSY